MSEEKVKQSGVKPLARIVNYADAEIEPVDFSIAPQYATKKVLQKAGLKISDIDYFEYNEAFSVVALANMKLLDIGEDRVNLHGGAVAMGHPIGMSGARIVQSLLTVMKNRGGKYGLAAICNGGGGSTAMIIENLQTK
jgi:acetyl-CoA C-acetyltransferase